MARRQSGNALVDGLNEQDAKPNGKKKTQRSPFEVHLSDEKEAWLKYFLAREIQYAIDARMNIVGDDMSLDDAHKKYLGGDDFLTKDTPWPGASNLGSPIVTQYVDAMRSRIMATIFTDPLWIVEGLGASASKAWLVEEFMQWKADQTKLHGYVGRAIHNALIEGTGILEVADRVVLRKVLRKIRAAVKTSPDGLVTLGNDGQPQTIQNDLGRYVEAQGSQDPHQAMVVADIVRAAVGPSYRVHSMKDFYILPGHAAEIEDVWGYAKRVFRKLTELKCRERDGYYENTDRLGGPASNDRTTPTGGVGDFNEKQREGQDIAPQQVEETAEKEIWELTLLLDLDDDGYEEWYIITWSQFYREILRVQYQDYDTPQYILLTPFPRPNSVWGFSFAKDKLGSLYDEHATLRNIFMDRLILKTNAPILQSDGGLWNPALKPIGPGKVIPVRDVANELKQMEVSDVPQSVPLAMKDTLSNAERVAGLNDTTTGQLAQADRTYGEVKLVTQQSWIRIDEVVKNLQQGIEDLFQIILTIYENKLQDEPEPWPGDILISMQARAIDMAEVDQMITADTLHGSFRGKPRGSVEASDFQQMRADMVQMITAITQLGQTVPALRMQLNNPSVVRSILAQIARIYRWPDRQNLLGTFTGNPPPSPPQPTPGPGGPGAPGGTPGAPARPPVGVKGVSNQPAPPGAPPPSPNAGV